MSTNKKPISEETMKQQSYFVVKSNEIIQHSRYSLSMRQNKMLLYLISKIKPGDNGDETYYVSMREFCKVCNIDTYGGFNISDAKRIMKTLRDWSMYLQTGDDEDILLSWITKVHRNGDVFAFSFTEDILPYLYNLKKHFTKYSLENVLAMKSKYGIRLYELLKSYEYLNINIEISLEDLHERLGVKKYKRYPDFRRYVLETAVDEINEYSDIEVKYETVQGSKRKTEAIVFSVTQPDIWQSSERMQRKRQRLEERGERGE